MRNSFSRRDVLKGSTALAATVFASPVRAAPPPPAAVTPALIEAAKKEGKVIWYTSVDLPLAERVGKSFEAKYPGIAVRVERTGAERVFTRIAQEYGSNIHAVDVVNSSDAAHLIVWKRNGWLEPYVPEDVAQHYPAEHKDPDGTFASFRIFMCPLGYNTSLVKPEDAPKSFADLLQPKWVAKIVKAHPSYSGTALTATFQIARDIGWDYLEKLAKQRVMQVQSSTEPPKKLALGERAIMADGNEYVLLVMKKEGNPVEPIYPKEGSPLVISPSAIMKQAPHPNASKLFQNYLFSLEGQQALIDIGLMRSFHDQAKEPPGIPTFQDIKVMKEDAAAVVDQVEKIKERYRKAFGT
jgi:iron(III) transport system substrate-binding protein